jgi:hypothetical protein
MPSITQIINVKNSLLLLVVALLASAQTSCTRRVYWPSDHRHRASLPVAPSRAARITVLAEGRDYAGWSPAQPACQQQAFFPSHSLKK